MISIALNSSAAFTTCRTASFEARLFVVLARFAPPLDDFSGELLFHDASFPLYSWYSRITYVHQMSSTKGRDVLVLSLPAHKCRQVIMHPRIDSALFSLCATTCSLGAISFIVFFTWEWTPGSTLAGQLKIHSTPLDDNSLWIFAATNSWAMGSNEVLPVVAPYPDHRSTTAHKISRQIIQESVEKSWAISKWMALVECG